MEIQTTTTTELRWELDGSGDMQCTIEDDAIKSLSFCPIGGSGAACFSSTDEKHLRNVLKALSELFGHIDKQRHDS